MTKGQKIGLIVGLLFLAGGAAGAYFYFDKKKKDKEDKTDIDKCVDRDVQRNAV